MSCSRAEVLTALRQSRRALTPYNLAIMMNKSPIQVGNVLRVLYFMGKAERIRSRANGNRQWLYKAMDGESR
jgi:hypothetical protein